MVTLDVIGVPVWSFVGVKTFELITYVDHESHRTPEIKCRRFWHEIERSDVEEVCEWNFPQARDCLEE